MILLSMVHISSDVHLSLKNADLINSQKKINVLHSFLVASITEVCETKSVVSKNDLLGSGCIALKIGCMSIKLEFLGVKIKRR